MLLRLPTGDPASAWSEMVCSYSGTLSSFTCLSMKAEFQSFPQHAITGKQSRKQSPEVVCSKAVSARFNTPHRFF